MLRGTAVVVTDLDPLMKGAGAAPPCPLRIPLLLSMRRQPPVDSQTQAPEFPAEAREQALRTLRTRTEAERLLLRMQAVSRLIQERVEAALRGSQGGQPPAP